MKNFLYDLLIEPFTDGDFLGYFIGFIMWVVFLSVTFLLLLLGFWLVDSSFMPIKEKDGVIVGKFYNPEYETTTYTQIGDVNIPTTTYHDETFYVVVEIDGLKDDVAVYESYYDKAKKGDILHCTYTNGRIGETLYIKTIEDK